MIQIIDSLKTMRDFVQTFAEDRIFSAPVQSDPAQLARNLERSVQNPDCYRTLGVYDGETLIGMFTCLILREEAYLELLVGLSREETAYSELMRYLKQHFSGYRADFVYNPRNFRMNGILKRVGAHFYPEQLKMYLNRLNPRKIDCTVVPYAEQYREGYIAIHDDELRYWTAEKTIQAADRFSIFLALDGKRVVGYIDVTRGHAVNEPVDLFVCADARRKGYGRALLQTAIENSTSERMELLVDRENAPARRLYESIGFAVDERGGNQTATLTL